MKKVEDYESTKKAISVLKKNASDRTESDLNVLVKLASVLPFLLSAAP